MEENGGKKLVRREDNKRAGFKKTADSDGRGI